MITFGLASLASAYSHTPDQLIFARALMGIGGAAVLPATLSIISNVFDPRERGKAIGIWAGSVGLGVAIGPVLGGALLEKFWWGSVFLINVPIVMVGVIVILALVPESRDPKPGRVDIVGVLLSIVGLIGLVYGIVVGGDHGFGQLQAWGSIIGGIVVLAAFVVVGAAHRVPVARREAVPQPAVLGLGRRGRPGLLRGHGHAVLHVVLPAAGARLLAAAVRSALRAVRGRAADLRAAQRHLRAPLRSEGRLRGRSGHRRSRHRRVTCCSASTTPIWVLGVLFFFQGVGMANVMPPATESIMASLPREKAGVGSAIGNTVRQVAGALGIAILGSLLSAVYRSNISDHLSAIPAGQRADAGNSVASTYAAAEHASPTVAGQLVDAGNDAFVIGDALGAPRCRDRRPDRRHRGHRVAADEGGARRRCRKAGAGADRDPR